LFICRGEVLAMHTRQRRDQIKLRDEEADQLAPVSQRHHQLGTTLPERSHGRRVKSSFWTSIGPLALSR